VPCGIDATLPAGSAVFGDFSQLQILTDETVDISILRQGSSNGLKGSAEMFAFADFDVMVANEAAFVRVINI
jgi:hypothetical protein